MKVSPPLKWFGGKHYLAKWIVGLMPPRCKNPNKPDPADPGWLHYVEPYAGGLSVLLANDPEGVSEVVNDINHNLTMFWRVMQSHDDFLNFRRRIEATPFSEEEYDQAAKRLTRSLGSDGAAYWDKAADFFVACRQSLSGRMKGFSGVTRTRTRQGMNNEVSAWLSCVEGLPAVHDRLKRVLIVGPKDALEVIRKEDGPRTLFYLDPPYLHETRTAKDVYAHEMTEGQHRSLLRTIMGIEGRFLLSGYHSELYDSLAARYGWRCHECDIANHAAGGGEKRRMTECVWTNF